MSKSTKIATAGLYINCGSLNFRAMLCLRHLLFASVQFRDFLFSEIRGISVSQKFHVTRY